MEASPSQDHLTDRQRRFVEEYLVDLNAAAAAIRAGYAATSARTVGPRLKALPKIRAALEAAMAERRRRVAVTQDRVIEELARIAFADIRDFADWDAEGVRLRPSQALKAGQTACVAELVESAAKAGKGVRLKLHSKTQALAALARHLGSRTAGEADPPQALSVVTWVPEPVPPLPQDQPDDQTTAPWPPPDSPP